MATQSGAPKKGPRWHARFIKALSERGNILRACEAVKIGRRTVYTHKAKYPDFSDEWDAALEVAADALEDEARRRAFDGVLEPVFYQGVSVESVRKYSDTLLIFLLKGNRPAKFRERHEITGGGGGPLQFSGPVLSIGPDGAPVPWEKGVDPPDPKGNGGSNGSS